MSCVSSRGNGSLSGLCAWRRLNSLHSNDYNDNDNKTSSSVISSYYETTKLSPQQRRQQQRQQDVIVGDFVVLRDVLWRRPNSLHDDDSNNNKTSSSSAISSYYETCSGNLATCPDLDCDELEMSVPALCPQDCISAYIARHSSLVYFTVSLEVTSNRYFLRVRLSVSKDLIAAAIY